MDVAQIAENINTGVHDFIAKILNLTRSNEVLEISLKTKKSIEL